MKQLKLHHSLLALAAVMLGLTFASCDDDDDDDVQATVADAVAGSYEATASATFAYISYDMVNTGDVVTIVKSGDETVSVTYEGVTWGTGSFADVAVSESGSGYALSGSGTLTMSAHSSTSDYEATIEGTIVDGSDFEIVISVPSVMGGTTVTLTPTVLADYVVGDHTVYSEVLFSYITSPMTYVDETISITKTGDATVDVSYVSDTWGEWTASGATVTATSSGYTIEGTGTAAVSYHGTATYEYECTLTATLDADGTITELVYYAEFMGGTTITCYEADAPASYEVAGDYTGTLAMTVMGSDAGTVEDMGISVAAEDEESVSLTIDAFTAMSTMAIGEIEISGISVTAGDEGYTLTNEDFTVEGVSLNETSTIAVTGSMEGTIDADGNASLTFNLTFGSMPMPVVCVYTGALAE